MIEQNSKKEHNINVNSPEKLYLTTFFQIFNISFICMNSTILCPHTAHSYERFQSL